MDWDCELKNESLEHMLTVYQDHIEELEAEAKEMKAEIVFLKEQLEYKTLGKPNYDKDFLLS
tara:strand:+ start:837 stop:1022 length:186 start_codon:yes stop_codon:yes gene_type:complete